ncbi:MULTISPECIES: hypothetical protein [Devosia]|uniref:hypothetical protein n=1 Tax=Devosia TaxID=46913 RepID=UPI0013009B39|nr:MULTISPECIES: hypothetical protein [Devosia]
MRQIVPMLNRIVSAVGEVAVHMAMTGGFFNNRGNGMVVGCRRRNWRNQKAAKNQRQEHHQPFCGLLNHVSSLQWQGKTFVNEPVARYGSNPVPCPINADFSAGIRPSRSKGGAAISLPIGPKGNHSWAALTFCRQIAVRTPRSLSRWTEGLRRFPYPDGQMHDCKSS